MKIKPSSFSFTSLFSSRARGKAGVGSPRRRPTVGVEVLEARIAPAITLIGVPNWVENGPGPGVADGAVEVPGSDEISGAIQSIAVNPFNNAEIIVGTVNGGVWKTTNANPASPAAATWTQLTDDLGALGIGAVAYDPADPTGMTFYAGTGTFSNSFTAGGPAIGIYKTTDGGATWTLGDTATLSGHRIRNIEANGQTVLVAAIDGSGISQFDSRNFASLGGGLFRSADGGTSFVQEGPGNGGLPNGAVTSLIVDPQTATTYYAAVVGGTSGVYVSTDSGDTWNPVNTGLTNLAGSSDIELAVQRVAGTTTLFASVATGDTLNGVFNSTNGGTNWNSLAGALPAATGGASFGEKIQLAADPVNANVVYLAGQGGGTNIFRYNPGGSNWVGINGTGLAAGNSSPHPDPRDLKFLGNNTLLEADDGGIYVLPTPTNANTTGWDFIGGNIAAVEFYSVAYDSVNNIMVGGTQDNGSQHQDSTGSFNWTDVRGGDGQTQQADTTSLGGNTLQYSLSNNFHFFERNEYTAANAFVSAAQVQLRSTAGGANFDALSAADNAFNGFDFQPYTLNTVDPRLMMLGYNGLYQDVDNTGRAGDVITNISANVGAVSGTFSAIEYGGMRAGAGQVNVAVVGTRGGDLFFRGEGGPAFTNVSNGGTGEIPGAGAVDDVAFDPQDWRQVYVAKGGQVWFTPDITDLGTAGNGFRVIGSGGGDNLGAISSQVAAVALVDTTPAVAGDSTLLAGGLGGVFKLTLETGLWTEIGLNLPGTVVRDIRFSGADDLLTIGTFGRGAWTLSSASTAIDGPGILQITGDTDFANQNDVLKLVRNQANPSMLDIFLNNNTDVPNLKVPLAALNQINVSLLGGSDTFTLDSSNGLIDVLTGIIYNGGAGHDAMQLLQTGGAQTSHVYSIGPDNGQGSSIITGPGGEQRVDFENIEPVLDLVPAASLIVNATTANNAINYSQGSVAANGLVTIDNFESIEFSNKTNLVINGLAGDDTINLNNPTAPTGMSGTITVNGGDPSVGDTVIANGTAGADAVTFNPTSINSANFTGAGPVPIFITTTEHIIYDNLGGADTLTVNGTSEDDVVTFDTASGGGSGSFRSNLGPDFDFAAVAGVTVNGGTGGFDVAIIGGAEGADTVTSAASVITLTRGAYSGTLTIGTNVDSIEVNTLGGNDSVNLATFAGAAAIIRGGDGNDTIIGTTLGDTIYGGFGNDVLVGGAGDDDQYGEDGNDIFGNLTLTSDGVADDAGVDRNSGGPGFDNFVWEPGDGADFNNGGEDGADIFRFFGSAAANVFTLRPGATPTHFNALIGAVNIDNHGVEDVVVDGQGGSDTFLVDDLFTTEVLSLNLVLGTADAAADFVTVNARAANDNLLVSTPAAGAVRISGLRYNVNLTAAELADGLTLNGNDGNDSINVVVGVAAIMGVTLNGGTGDDVLAGDAAIINGNDGNDTLIGSAINNNFDGGAGDDTFLGNGGTDNVGGGAGSSVGDTILLPGTAGIDALSLSLDATGHLLATVNGLTTTYGNFLGGPIATSGIERIKADGQDGNDALTVDSTLGALPIPVSYDGGLSGDSLTLTGGTATADTYAPGPIPGAGTSTIVIGGVTQTVNFTGLEPVLDLVAGPLIVNGTNAANVIDYRQGSVAANGLVSMDGFETIEFSNKTILALNGLAGSDTININNPATPTGLTNIAIDGGAGDDSLALFGTPIADDFTFTGIDTTTGTLTLTGLAPVLYVGTEHALLLGLAGNDIFRVGSAAGRVEIIGGEGSDTANFFDAPSGVVFNLDLLHDDQPVNATGAIVSLGEVVENFVGTPFNDTIFANLRAFVRSIDGRTPSMLPGVPGSPVPPGDRLTVDALGQFAVVTKLDANTGSVASPSYALLSYDEIETLKVINSSGGGGFNDGNAFTASISYRVSKTPTDVAAGDLNGDGFDDIVTVNARRKSVSVLLARGDGTFFPPVNFATGGAGPLTVELANIDDNFNIAVGDSDLDIIVTNSQSRSVGVLLNDGLGGFGPATTFRTAGKPAVLRVADFNEDGILDLATLSKATSTISVLLNTGGGVGGTASFGAFTRVKPGGKSASDFVVGNFDGDALGHLDFAVVRAAAKSLVVATGDGLGGFTAQATRYKVGLNPTGIALADFNNDGITDIAVNHKVAQFVSVLIGRGSAGGDLFEPQIQTAFARAIRASDTLLSGDFNGDGNADLAFGSDSGAALRVALGMGTGLFLPVVRFSLATVPGSVLGARFGSGLAIGDFNGDGAADIVEVNQRTSTINVIIRNPTV